MSKNCLRGVAEKGGRHENGENSAIVVRGIDAPVRFYAVCISLMYLHLVFQFAGAMFYAVFVCNACLALFYIF